MGSIVSGVMSLAGGSGGSAPTLDMSKQIAANKATTDTAMTNAAQTQATATALNGQSQNTLKNVVGQETPAMAAVNKQANTNLSTYGNTFVGLQKQQADEAANYNSDSNRKQLAGQAVSDSNQATQASLKNQRDQLASEGVDPASVHGAGLEQQAAIQGAANAAGAATQSGLQTAATGRQLVAGANQLGMQVGDAGTRAAEAAAGIGSGIVANTNNTNNSNVNNLTASNGALNVATGANNASADAANKQFNAQQTSYQDNVAAQASKSAAIGGIVSGAASKMEHGGVVTPPAVRMPGIPQAVPTNYHGGPINSKGAFATPIVPGTTDTKLIAATPGEFMLPKDVVEHMGHEKLHKLIDKTREDVAKRRGIPMHHQLSSAHTSQGA